MINVIFPYYMKKKLHKAPAYTRNISHIILFQ